MKKIVIIGNSIAAEIFYGVLKNDNRYEVVAFSVDKKYIKEDTLCNLEVIALDDLPHKYPSQNHNLILGMGYKNINIDREKMFTRVKELGYSIENYIHPSAVIMTQNIGEGCIVLANSVLEPYSTVGNNCVIWSNCTVAHHSVIEDNCWVASGTVIAGEAKIKTNCFLGVGVTIVDKVTVATHNIIGAATLITKDTKANEVYLSRNGEKHRFDSINYAKFFGI